MANKLYEENDIAAIATAIRSKNGKSDTYKVSQMAAAIDDISGGGADVVNGIIKNFKAQASTVSAAAFVEFVELTASNDTQLTTTSGQYNYASAVQIDTNKIFISLGNSQYLFGTVCTISGSTITAGTTTQLSTTANSYAYASPVKLDTNKVFIAHPNGTNYLHGMICTISGTTITVATDTQLVTFASGSSPYEYASSVLIDTNKVFISHRSGTFLYALVCTISGNTITVGTDTPLSQITNAFQNANAVKLDTNKVFIAHRNGNYLYAMICTISGTTITAGTDTQLSTVVNSYVWNSVALMDTNKVFIAHRSGFYINAIVCTISGTTITAGTDTALPAIWTNSYYYASVRQIDTNKVFIAHQGENSNLYGIICTISGTSIASGTDTRLSTLTTSCQFASTVLLDTNKVFISHRGGNFLYSKVLDIYDSPRVIESTSKIQGLTKTECTATTSGQVWVLDN